MVQVYHSLDTNAPEKVLNLKGAHNTRTEWLPEDINRTKFVIQILNWIKEFITWNTGLQGQSSGDRMLWKNWSSEQFKVLNLQTSVDSENSSNCVTARRRTNVGRSACPRWDAQLRGIGNYSNHSWCQSKEDPTDRKRSSCGENRWSLGTPPKWNLDPF